MSTNPQPPPTPLDSFVPLYNVLKIFFFACLLILTTVQREWPQQWPSLLGELDALCRIGETQTELVMFILLRLVEGNSSHVHTS